jgi:hypothetical protein
MDPGIVTEIDKYRQGWTGGLPETPCGYGSRLDQTELQREVIARWVAEYQVSTLVDIGAGDLNWIKHMDWPHPVAYIPLDLVPRHPDVRAFDLIHEVPPKADMALCLWVLNHLPDDHSRVALANLRKADIRYLVYTWWPAMPSFLDLGYADRVVIRERIGAELRLLKC